MKDCNNCLEVTDQCGEVPVEKLTYGDWLRTHAQA